MGYVGVQLNAPTVQMPRTRTPKFPFAAEARRMLRQRSGRAHAILSGRGAAAIYAVLRALDLHDRLVLIPANTCYIVLWAVILSGNQPMLVDVDPLTGNVSRETLERCAAPNPAVVIPAQMYGIPAQMAAICAWAREKGVFVIEDAALTVAPSLEGENDRQSDRHTFTQPDDVTDGVSILSFGAGKIIDVDGGGALLVSDERHAAEIERVLSGLPIWTERLSQLNRQWLEIYWALHQFETDTPRLTELYPTLFSIYGEIVRCRLPESHWRDLPDALRGLDANLSHRAEIARLYDQRLNVEPLRTLARPDGAALWKYPLLVPRDQRDGLLRSLWEAQIFEATRWYPSLQAMQSALAPDVSNAPTPAADQLAAEIINLPLAPETDRAIAGKVIEVILRYFEERL